jgi:hypothetical protein
MFFRCRKSPEHDLDRELHSHLELETDEQQERGPSPDEARYTARRAFGNTTHVKEEVREMWGWASFERLWHDLRYAARGVRRNPGFALVIVLSLALGIGANTAILGAERRALPPAARCTPGAAICTGHHRVQVPRAPAFLLSVIRTDARRHRAEWSRCNEPRCAHVQPVTGEGEQDITRVQLVSGEYVTLLGLAPTRGRLLGRADNLTIGQHSVAVVSHAFWQRKLGGSPAVLGRSIDLNGAPFTIVGMAPPGFNGLWLESPVDTWIPLMMQAAAHYQQNFSSSNTNEDKPWPNQEGIRWLDVMVRTPGNLPARQGVFQRWLEGHAR